MTWKNKTYKENGGETPLDALCENCHMRAASHWGTYNDMCPCVTEVHRATLVQDHIMSSKAFFILWNPSHPSTPQKKYKSREHANQDANLLAMKHPGQEIFVLRAVGSFATAPVTLVEKNYE